MRFIDLTAVTEDRWGTQFDRRYLPSDLLVRQVADILSRIRVNGDAALVDFIRRFDCPGMESGELRIDQEEITAARNHLPPKLKEALTTAKRNVQEFAERSRRIDWEFKNRQGARVGERFFPICRVGIYVPAGTAPLISSAIMTVAIAQAVGVREIVAVSPVSKSKKMEPALLAALDLAGATEIYKVGGAHAIGALAFGTESIRQVDKIFGPGNAFVTEAKRQVFGYVGIDLLPGPSEILVIADDSADTAWVAADLLAQAEHGAGTVVAVVSWNREILQRVQTEVTAALPKLSRKEYLEGVLSERAYAVLTSDREQAIRFANAFAPEHLALMIREAREAASQFSTAGAIFVGNYSAVAAGDFVAGPSHVLPTGGAAKSFGGLTADLFQRRASVLEFDEAALKQSLPYVVSFSEAEKLDAHGASVRRRFE
ncbi:MAG: histidinol dehydrogenase [Verrucomicrobia bacterium]|nr:histidinol dehydrogenase [Verrucomicrobiota bacterium]